MDAPVSASKPRSLGALAGTAGFALASLTGFVALFAGLGTRWGWWDYRTGFSILTVAVWSGLIAAAISVVAIANALRHGPRRALIFGIHGLIIGALVFGVPWFVVHEGRKLPPIHDITTDTEDPPAFVAVLPLRKDSPNTVEYGGAELAAQQKKGYPDLGPATLPMPPRAAFELALDVARRSGWEIVAAAAGDNRIEATATTDWFGFKDDIVIRIKPKDAGSRVDVRSVSRVGRSDLGTNARRIREFLRQLTAGKTNP
ncbi:MAG: hypothetical protein JWN94_969 [Betaproteobacteria bacterium]|nr:hypothetical protein [Betaproteobacteria bacterium]